MKRWRLAILLLSCLLLVTGCMETNVLERLSIMVAVGYDAQDDGSIHVTASFIESQPDAKEHNRTGTVKAHTTKGARVRLNQQLPFKVATGQVRTILLNKKMFEKNLLDEVEALSRDPSYGDLIYLAMVDESAEKLMSHQYKDIPNVGIYLNSLFEHNIKYSWCPPTTLHEFTRCRDRQATELVMPIVQMEGDTIKINSLALFNENRIAGEANAKEAYYIKALTSGVKKFQYESAIKKEVIENSPIRPYFKHSLKEPDVKFVYEVIDSKGNIKLIDREALEFDVNIKMNVDIQEITEHYLFQEPGAMDALKHELEKDLTEDLQNLLNRLRKIHVDCIGVGEKYRSMTPHTDLVGSKWREAFANAKLNARVEIDIVRTGTIQ